MSFFEAYILTENVQIDGDIVRVWYSVPLLQDPEPTVMNIVQEDEADAANVEANVALTTEGSLGGGPTPQYLPGTLHRCLLWVGWIWSRLWSCLHHRKLHRKRS